MAAKGLPRAIQALLDRTVLATFSVRPPPRSIAESLAIHGRVTGTAGNAGKIIHYRQQMCPVTKQRLETLHVLFEDLQDRPGDAAQNHVYWPGAPKQVAEADWTELERALVNSGKTHENHAEISIERVTRDQSKILELVNVAPSESAQKKDLGESLPGSTAKE